MKQTQNKFNNGFSLVEVLAAVGIIGIIAFLAIPNIVEIKRDSERSLAITRAEGINMGVASYIQANGRDAVANEWAGLNPNQRYERIRPFLSFAPTGLDDFQPSGFVITPPEDLRNLNKSLLHTGDDSTIDENRIFY